MKSLFHSNILVIFGDLLIQHHANITETSLSDRNQTWIHNHLDRKQTISHLDWVYNCNFVAVVTVVTLSINNNIKILQNIKQGFKRTISWNKYRSEIKIQPKNNNLFYLIDPTFRKISRVFVLSFKYGKNDPRRDSFNKYYMQLV